MDALPRLFYAIKPTKSIERSIIYGVEYLYAHLPEWETVHRHDIPEPGKTVEGMEPRVLSSNADGERY
jgi:hypothetical protein